MSTLSEALGAPYGAAPTPELCFPKPPVDRSESWSMSKWGKRSYLIFISLLVLLAGLCVYFWMRRNKSTSSTLPQTSTGASASEQTTKLDSPTSTFKSETGSHVNAAHFSPDIHSPYNFHYQKKLQDAIALSPPNNSAAPTIT